MYFVGIELSYVWKIDTCLSFPHFCSVIDRNSTYMGLNVSQEIHIINWSPKLFSEVFQIRSGIWHHSKCHTPFGLVSYHFTTGLFLQLLITSAIQSPKNKKDMKKGSPIPPSHGVVWWGKLLVPDMVWRSTSPWRRTVLSFSPVPFSPAVSSHQGRQRCFSAVLRACKHPVHGKKGADTGMSP